MIILGIETTAHTFGVGIVRAAIDSSTGKESCEVLANEKDSYSSASHGMIPGDIAKHHEQVKEEVLHKALDVAAVSWEEIDAIAYSAGPGLDPVLWTGYHFAKALSEQHKKELIRVNHCVAHLMIGKVLAQAQNPLYLYVSGVNTQVLYASGKHGNFRFHVMGETLDIGLGNMFDKFGRIIGLGFPAGPAIDRLAEQGSIYLPLPYVVKGMDTSFSGILTKARQLYEQSVSYAQHFKSQSGNLPSPSYFGPESADTKAIMQRLNSKLQETISKEDLCYSLSETCFAQMTEVSERALAHTGSDTIILVGGVGASKRFCQMMQTMCDARGARFFSVPRALAGDQGAMIAWRGAQWLAYGGQDDANVPETVDAQWRTDEV